MTTADTTINVPKLTRMSGYMDILQALTGAALLLFMWSHMLLVSSVLLGKDGQGEYYMNSLAHFFEATYMAQVGGPLIFIGMIIHFAMAARKMPWRLDEQRTIWKHGRMLRHTETTMWIVQAVTAMVILVLGSVHVWTVLTALPISAEASALRVQGGDGFPYWLVLYAVLLPMVELHVGIGFFRLGVKWGFVKRKGRTWYSGLEKLLLAFFVGIGIVTLYTFATMPVGG